MTSRKDYEEARENHKKGGPYKSAMDAIKSPTFSKVHNARRSLAKSKALEGKKGEKEKTFKYNGKKVSKEEHHKLKEDYLKGTQRLY